MELHLLTPLKHAVSVHVLPIQILAYQKYQETASARVRPLEYGLDTPVTLLCYDAEVGRSLIGEPKKLASVWVPPPWGGDVADPIKAHPCRCVLPRRIWSFYVKGCGPEVSPKNWGAPPAAWAPPVASGRASPLQTRHFDPHIGYHAEFDRC